MHEKSPVLNAKSREHLGSRYCKRIRQSGGLPAVLYGHGQQPVPLTLDAKEAIGHLHKGEKVFQLDLGGASQVALVKGLQFDYLGTNIVHADFARVDLDERVRTRVPVHLTGEALGLKTAGAILMHPTNEVEIECRVRDLPDYIEVDIASLDVGHAITAADVKLPLPTMKMITDSHAIVAQIVIQLEQKVAEATEVAATAAQPEVITAKKEEPAADAAAGAKGGEKEKKK